MLYRSARQGFGAGSTVAMSCEAFIGVLACARAADGEFPEAERALLDLICHSHRFTRHLSRDAYVDAVSSVKSRIAQAGWESAIDEYLERIPEPWAYSTLLSAIDICLIDADEDSNELACIASIATHFEIPMTEVNEFMEWFRVKNGVLGERQADRKAPQKTRAGARR